QEIRSWQRPQHPLISRLVRGSCFWQRRNSPTEREVQSSVNLPMATMSAEPTMPAARRTSRRIRLGGVDIGGGAPVSIQSMAVTKTEDAAPTPIQVHAPS